MRVRKREGLEDAGWRGGGTSAFLGLTPAEEALVELRLRLASGLRATRTRRRLTQMGLAKAIGSSQSRIAKMEAGDPSVSIDLMVRSLLVLGASVADLARIIAPRRSAGTDLPSR